MKDWINKLKSNNPRERIEACRKLGNNQTEFNLRSLINTIEYDNNIDVRLAAIEGLRNFGNKVFVY